MRNQTVMDQTHDPLSLALPLPITTPTVTAPHLPAEPLDRARRFRRLASAVAHAGYLLGIASRPPGRPLTTFSGVEAMHPDEIRAGFLLGDYRSGGLGGSGSPRSLRNSGRRW